MLLITHLGLLRVPMPAHQMTHQSRRRARTLPRANRAERKTQSKLIINRPHSHPLRPTSCRLRLPTLRRNNSSQAARRDQNRIAQREFRLRKQQRVSVLLILHPLIVASCISVSLLRFKSGEGSALVMLRTIVMGPLGRVQVVVPRVVPMIPCNIKTGARRRGD